MLLRPPRGAFVTNAAADTMEGANGRGGAFREEKNRLQFNIYHKGNAFSSVSVVGSYQSILLRYVALSEINLRDVTLAA